MTDPSGRDAQAGAKKPTRRDLMKPVQLLGLALIAALFAGLVTLISMGFFQQRFATQSSHALMVGLVVAGITFIVVVVVIALLLLAVDPAQITHEIDRPVLLPPGENPPDAAAPKTTDAAASPAPQANADPGSEADAEPGSEADAAPDAAAPDTDEPTPHS
jgi:hypothetical protein